MELRLELNLDIDDTLDVGILQLNIAERMKTLPGARFQSLKRMDKLAPPNSNEIRMTLPKE